MYESRMTIWAGCWQVYKDYRRIKKLWVEIELTERFHRYREIPNVGYILSSGDVVIEKCCTEHCIFLVINKKKKNDRECKCSLSKEV